jgi:hypothetical protein
MLFKDYLISIDINTDEYLFNILNHMQQCNYDCNLYFSDLEQYKLKCEMYNGEVIYFGVNNDKYIDCNIVELQLKTKPDGKLKTFFYNQITSSLYEYYKFIKKHNDTDWYFKATIKYNPSFIEKFFITQLWSSFSMNFMCMK